MTIPVLGIPVLNVPKLVARLVSSINAPVDKLVFIHNRDEGQPNAELAQTLQRIQTARPRNINSVHIHTFRRNLGVSAAWNAIMLFHTAPWYLICNSDIKFEPSALAFIIASVDVRQPTCVWTFGIGMSAFAIANHTKESTGFFDENYFPAYSEDCDYVKRLSITQCPIAEVGGAHGKKRFLHTGSASLRPPSRASKVYMRVSHGGEGYNNWDYLRRRFGTISCDSHWRFKPDDPTSWKLDSVRRRERGGPEGCVACGTYSQELML